TALPLNVALPQKSDYSATFGANCISAPKINLTDWIGVARISISQKTCGDQETHRCGWTRGERDRKPMNRKPSDNPPEGMLCPKCKITPPTPRLSLLSTAAVTQ